MRGREVPQIWRQKVGGSRVDDRYAIASPVRLKIPTPPPSQPNRVTNFDRGNLEEI